MNVNYNQFDVEKIEFVPIGEIESIKNGERLFVEIDDISIIVFNIAGKIFAIGDICSHDGGPLDDGELDNFEVNCPRHGARFDVRDGKATRPPAVVAIPAYPVRQHAGIIEVGIPLGSK